MGFPSVSRLPDLQLVSSALARLLSLCSVYARHTWLLLGIVVNPSNCPKTRFQFGIHILPFSRLLKMRSNACVWSLVSIRA